MRGREGATADHRGVALQTWTVSPSTPTDIRTLPLPPRIRLTHVRLTHVRLTLVPIPIYAQGPGSPSSSPLLAHHHHLPAGGYTSLGGLSLGSGLPTTQGSWEARLLSWVGELLAGCGPLVGLLRRAA